MMWAKIRAVGFFLCALLWGGIMYLEGPTGLNITFLVVCVFFFVSDVYRLIKNS